MQADGVCGELLHSTLMCAANMMGQFNNRLARNSQVCNSRKQSGTSAPVEVLTSGSDGRAALAALLLPLLALFWLLLLLLLLLPFCWLLDHRPSSSSLSEVGCLPAPVPAQGRCKAWLLPCHLSKASACEVSNQSAAWT